MATLHQDSYLETYLKEVESEFKSDINDLKNFFVDKGYSDEKSNELTYSLNRVIYHVKRDKEERLKLEKKVLPLELWQKSF